MALYAEDSVPKATIVGQLASVCLFACTILDVEL